MGPMMRKPGVFGLEGDWNHDLRDNPTVEPILQLLYSFGGVEYIHRDIGTRPEFRALHQARLSNCSTTR